MKKGNPIALLPIGVFLVLYLGLGLLFEYGLHIPMGFYNIPIVIAFLVAILVACLQNRAVPFEEKLVIMGQGVGDKNIITMLLIFLTAGAFVGVVGRSSAQSVAYFMLDIIPARFAVAVLFVVACFVSTAMGTSVGTITLIMPIALEVAQASGFDTALCAGSVVGGAMFGDNLSFISDTTIAGFMDGMLDGTIPKEKHAYYMQTVSDEVKRLSRMVRSMLDISRLQSTGEEIKKARFDVTEALGRTLLTFEQKIEEKHLDVQVDMPEKAVYVMANEDAITQVIYNLIDNGVKFAKDGTPFLLTVATSGGKALVSVANYGPTIPPEELPLVFDRFHKSDKSRSMDKTGVGLGLYIVKTILGSHGEDISVTSRDGLTTFTFTLELTK